jgi:flagellar biogenesis protein FliO
LGYLAPIREIIALFCGGRLWFDAFALFILITLILFAIYDVSQLIDRSVTHNVPEFTPRRSCPIAINRFHHI